jgi:hypothetical protein
MPSIELTDDQVIELIRRMPPERRRAALLALAEDARARREARQEYAESQLRRVSAERGQDWDAMTEEEREAFIDGLVHEDRKCPG